MPNKKVLVIGKIQKLKDQVSTWLHDEGYIVLMAHSEIEAVNFLTHHGFAVLAVEAPLRDLFSQAPIPLVCFDRDTVQIDFLGQIKKATEDPW